MKLASRFNNRKAKLRITGLKQQKHLSPPELNPNGKRIWFHCASLGEFEQARPLIEKIKNKQSNTQIILTFFSASGFEIRKDFPDADAVFYLPPDKPKAAKAFVDKIKPDIAVWVKYEFWYHHLREIYRRGISLYLISARFQKKQIFFRFYGRFFRKMFRFFDHIFVQDENSKHLLYIYAFRNTSIAGDTRLDRVIQIAENAPENKLAKKFTANHLLMLAGSTWQADEEIICRYFNENPDKKLVIAPHEISGQHLRQLEKMFTASCIRYSKAEDADLSEYQILIIDNIGMLSSLYKYADFAYIGGGFGSGIHNTQEAGVYGIPVVFGPKYKGFTEAIDLLESKAFFSIKKFEEFKKITDNLYSDRDLRQTAGEKAKNYIYAGKGATDTIYKKIFKPGF